MRGSMLQRAISNQQSADSKQQTVKQQESVGQRQRVSAIRRPAVCCRLFTVYCSLPAHLEGFNRVKWKHQHQDFQQQAVSNPDD